MELRRKAYQKLLDWKTRWGGRTALMVEGARRVGKSHLVERFARNEYSSYIVIDFSNPRAGTIDAFERDFDDLDLFFSRLGYIYGVGLKRRESLIVFDEVQMYPRARELIKFLVADGRYDYIETGSLISIRRNIKDIVVPSEEMRMRLDPLDFEEFLWAMGDDLTYDFVKGCFEKGEALGPGAHHKVMGLFRQYMLVGGMPQAVLEYLETRDFRRTDETKRMILDLYRTDITRFANGYQAKVADIFDSIPSELSRKERNFRITSLGKNARNRDYEDAFMWLDDGFIVNTCWRSSDPSVGLSLNLDSSSRKCYMADTGLLVTMVFADSDVTEDDIYEAILSDRLKVNEGMIVENVVAQMLHASGHRLFYYASTPEGESRLEIDFLIRRDRKICPIDVRSSKKVRHCPLDRFRTRHGSRIGQPYLLYPGDVREVDGVTYLPLYMAGLLRWPSR